MSDDLSVRFFRGFLAEPNCDGCPLEPYGRVPPEGNLHARVALVGEGPGEEEEVQGRPFVGRSGALLVQLLELNGVCREEVWITNSSLCRSRTLTRRMEVRCPVCKPKQRKAPTPVTSDHACTMCNGTKRAVMDMAYNEKQIQTEATRHCTDRLVTELGYIRPRVVVPLGRFALEALIGKSAGILAHRGAIHVGAVPVMATTKERLYAQATEATMREGNAGL